MTAGIKSAMTFDQANILVHSLKDEIISRIIYIETEGRSRIEAGRNDMLAMIEPLEEAKTGLAIMADLESLLQELDDTSPVLPEAVIDKIGLGLGQIATVLRPAKH